jgi:hypothetical protein
MSEPDSHLPIEELDDQAGELRVIAATLRNEAATMTVTVPRSAFPEGASSGKLGAILTALSVQFGGATFVCVVAVEGRWKIRARNRKAGRFSLGEARRHLAALRLFASRLAATQLPSAARASSSDNSFARFSISFVTHAGNFVATL